MLRIALLALIFSISLTSSSILRELRSRRQIDPQYCHAIEGFDCKCSYYRVTCTTDRDLPSRINIEQNEKHKYQSVELTISAQGDITVTDQTFESIKELYIADGDDLEFVVKFENFTELDLASRIFNLIFPDNLPSYAKKHLTLEIYNPSVQPSDKPDLFQNLNVDSLKLYALYPFHGTFQQLFQGANIKYLRLNDGDIRSDLSQPFTGNIARLELAKQANSLSVHNFPVYPAHELIINAFYITDFNDEHPPNYANLGELRVYSSERIPANAFLRFPNIHTLQISSEKGIDPQALNGLNKLEKLTIKDTILSIELLNSVPSIKEFETNFEKLDEKTQCQFIEKLADGQVAIRDIPDVRVCTCISDYLNSAVGQSLCNAPYCDRSSCAVIKKNYDASTRTFKAPPAISRSDGSNALDPREVRVYTAPYQVTQQDQEKLQQTTSQPLEADPQRPDADEQNPWQLDESDNLPDLASWFEQGSCSLGKYLYQDHCILCTPGYYCPDRKSRISCPQGTIAPGYGFRACQECLRGWYSTCDTQESCLMCPKGFYCPTNNQEPQACPVGYYSHYAATECTKCPSGSYTTYTNSSYCFQCPMGYSCMDPTQCPQPCPAGTYQPDIMSTSCEPCPDEHQCGTTTNLLQCTAISCIQAEAWPCDQSRLSPPASDCTTISVKIFGVWA